MSNQCWIELFSDVGRVEFPTFMKAAVAAAFPDGAVVCGDFASTTTRKKPGPFGVSLKTGGADPRPLVQFWWDGPNRISCDQRIGEVGFWVAYRVMWELQRALTTEEGVPPRYDDGSEDDEPLPHPSTPLGFVEYALGGKVTPRGLMALKVLNEPYYATPLAPHLTPQPGP